MVPAVEDGAAEGGAVEFDFGLPESIEAPAFENPTSGSLDTGVTENPAWTTLKEKLPREFHSQVDPILSEWDRNVQAQFQANAAKVRAEYDKYNAYEPIVQQNIPADALLAAHNLVAQMNNNPVAFFEKYKNVLIQQGLLPEAQQVQNKIDEINEEDALRDPRVDQLAREQQALAQQQQQFFSTIQQQQALAAEAQADARIDQQIASDFDTLEQQVGRLPEYVRDEVINRALLMMQQQGRQVSVLEAYPEVVKLREAFLSTPRPGQLAPRAVPTGGGFPSQAPNADAYKTRDGRAQAIKEIIDRGRSS